MAGGGISLVALVLYFHPFYAIALGINPAILATQARTLGPLPIAGS